MIPQRTWVATVFTGAFVALTLAACLPERFPACKTDDECKTRGKAKVCVNMRCLECHYDGDCESGHVCSPTGQCQGIGDTTPESTDGGTSEGGPAEE